MMTEEEQESYPEACGSLHLTAFTLYPDINNYGRV